MKRSQINQLVDSSIEFMRELQFHLPPWAYWTPEQWKGKGVAAAEIVETMMGWDLTDFGSGDFAARGLILFTLRNGPATGVGKPYAEKIMIVREGQETPYHFHHGKMEDIINRGGGNLVLEIHGSTKDEELSSDPVEVKVDGLGRVVEPGGKVVLTPGQSICLEQRLYHRFWGEEGVGMVLVGEVSSVNDDLADNRFHEPVGRFPEIEEDEDPMHLLVTDYSRFL